MDNPHENVNLSENRPSTSYIENALSQENSLIFVPRSVDDTNANPNFSMQKSLPKLTPASSEPEIFMCNLRNFFFDRGLEFKIPKFYGDEIDLFKLWNIVHSLGGFEKVTTGKLWKYVGDRFNPPKTCTTLSWNFRQYYEKMLYGYEKNVGINENVVYDVSPLSDAKHLEIIRSGRKSNGSREFSISKNEKLISSSGKRSRNKFADSDGEESIPVHDSEKGKEKDAESYQTLKKEYENKHLRMEEGEKERQEGGNGEKREKGEEGEGERFESFPAIISDEGSADWVKINVKKSVDCFELFALVPGLMREEVRVQCEVSGKVIIAGEPEHLENPWGIIPFQKVVHLPGPIDAHKTTALMTLHGQLYVKAPIPKPEQQILPETGASKPDLYSEWLTMVYPQKPHNSPG